MPGLIELLIAYGICFGAMNKVDALYGKSAFTDALLKCSYCTGFHAGWLSWLLTLPLRGFDLSWQTVPQVGAWSFSAAVFCYGADTTLQLAESWIRKD